MQISASNAKPARPRAIPALALPSARHARRRCVALTPLLPSATHFWLWIRVLLQQFEWTGRFLRSWQAKPCVRISQQRAMRQHQQRYGEQMPANGETGYCAACPAAKYLPWPRYASFGADQRKKISKTCPTDSYMKISTGSLPTQAVIKQRTKSTLQCHR